MQRFFESLKINFSVILKVMFKISGSIFTVFSVLFVFIDWSDLKINKISHRISILSLVVFGSFILSLVWVLYICKVKNIWTKGKNKVTAIYGDIYKIGFDKRNKNSKIVVIPVNDTFETIVENSSETITKPLVSEHTNHGKWIKLFCKYNKITPEELNERIQNNLLMQGNSPIKVYTKEEKQRGNLNSYELGTVAIIDGINRVKFYLLAISKFDGLNNAQSTKKEVRNATESLIDYYDKNGQADPMFIPLMGTGKSRANMTHIQSFNVIKSCILTSEKSITGEINIVVYSKDKERVSIFK